MLATNKIKCRHNAPKILILNFPNQTNGRRKKKQRIKKKYEVNSFQKPLLIPVIHCSYSSNITMLNFQWCFVKRREKNKYKINTI